MYELITLNNQFLNLDVLDEENLIKKECGFTGSNATLLKGKDKSYLFTDRRYELQAKEEVKDKNIEVVFDKLRYWLLDNNPQEKVFYNPWCHSIAEVQKFPNNFVAKGKEPLYKIDKEPFEYDVEYAGVVACKKVLDFREFLERQNLDAYIITEPTDLSWLLNIRSSVLPHTPAYRAFAVVNKDGVVQLFNHPRQMKKYKKVGLWEEDTPAIFKKYVKNYTNIKSSIFWSKAKKNDIEVRNSKEAHIKDGVAITKLLYWIYNNKKSKTEFEVAEKLHKIREKQEGFFSESFASIIASGKNSAVPHYQPTKDKSEKVAKDMLLMDVGSHFFGGTTDMTRTISLGKPTLEQIKHFTLVLKGHINLATQKFNKSYSGRQLDILARSPLLNEGLDYNHGTGHGVGNFSGVHEAPSISKNGQSSLMAKNMIFSIEPAVYFENEYGIRIENLYVIKENKEEVMSFEPLTFVPLDNSLIDINSLTDKEKTFVFNYQKEVYKKLEKFLNDKEKAWLASYISFNVVNIQS